MVHVINPGNKSGKILVHYSTWLGILNTFLSIFYSKSFWFCLVLVFLQFFVFGIMFPPYFFCGIFQEKSSRQNGSWHKNIIKTFCGGICWRLVSNDNKFIPMKLLESQNRKRNSDFSLRTFFSFFFAENCLNSEIGNRFLKSETEFRIPSLLESRNCYPKLESPA